MGTKFSAGMKLRAKSSMESYWILLEVAQYKDMSLQYEVGVANRVEKFCASDSVGPID